MRLNKLNSNWILVSVALIFGGFSAWTINNHLTDQANEIENRSRLPIISRVVASKNLTKGSILTLDNLAVREFNDPLSGFSSVDPADVDILIGKVLIHDVQEGQLVLSDLVAHRASDHLVAKLDSGMRAVTIPVDQINSMSGLLKPTDRIDLLVTFDHLGQRITSPLLTAIEVIATGQDTSGIVTHKEDQPFYETVTLATTADQAVKLVAARQSGTITAVLSQPIRPDSVQPGSNHLSGHLAKLLGLEPVQQENIQIIYGDRPESQVQFQEDGTDPAIQAAMTSASRY